MGKYYSTPVKAPKPRVERPHPIWRGLGCLLMVIVPILSYALADITVGSNWAQQYIPYQLMGNPVLPASLWNLGFLNPVLFFIQSQNNLYAILVFFIFYVVILGALVSAVNAFVYQTIAPPRYGPQDAPPPKVKIKPYKR